MSTAIEALKKLDEIEAEMRRVGYWSEVAEDACGLKFRSYVDAPTFQLWLQGLFLPNARAAAREGRLPVRSQASEIVRRQYASYANQPDARKLFDLIREFDDLCLKASSPKSA